MDRLAEAVDGECEAFSRLGFVVVGIGASAGGLEAVTSFLDVMPAESGMAFVLVQHLPPDRESMLPEILGRHTKMKCVEITEGMKVEGNVVYVIRPGRTLTLEQGVFRLGEPVEKRGHRKPVDDFFKSLAAEQRERAICVVMSGMGTNGTMGAEEVKAVGGVCIAQDPESGEVSGDAAEFGRGGAGGSGIASGGDAGCVDEVCVASLCKKWGRGVGDGRGERSAGIQGDIVLFADADAA